MDDDAVAVERHESEAWAACVAAAGRAEGNPLGAEVGEVGGTRVSSLTKVGFWLFNRVIGCGAGSAATPDDVARLTQWYAERGQGDFVVEVSPAASPENLDDLLVRAGLARREYRQAKVWRRPTETPVPDGIELRELTAADAPAFAAVSVAAWGTPPFLAPWFAGTFGMNGFRHFGVVEDGDVVSTGAMYVSGGLAWLGFGATLPTHRGRGMQGATFARRISEAAEMGCHLVHTETENRPGNNSLHNMLRLGFEHAYDKALYGPTPAE